jgi:hypothetical protein
MLERIAASGARRDPHAGRAQSLDPLPDRGPRGAGLAREAVAAGGAFGEPGEEVAVVHSVCVGRRVVRGKRRFYGSPARRAVAGLQLSASAPHPRYSPGPIPLAVHPTAPGSSHDFPCPVLRIDAARQHERCCARCAPGGPGGGGGGKGGNIQQCDEVDSAVAAATAKAPAKPRVTASITQPVRSVKAVKALPAARGDTDDDAPRMPTPRWHSFLPGMFR